MNNTTDGLNINNGTSNQQQNIQYYYAKNGQQFGPVSDIQISQFIMNGEINAFSYLWKTGMSEWSLATNFLEFQNLLK